ncbi:MAG: hypothetical protein KGV56_00580 [Gammaproteobacteria bacterium]|nr:hypothetical protein [Gammaproteobacteria bacterium]
MSDLNENWEPTFGTIYTWFAMDKNGLIAVMINNCWGDLPKAILKKEAIELLLDDLNEYTWDESQKYKNNLPDKQGDLVVDLYCYWMNKNLNLEMIVNHYKRNFEEGKSSDANLSVNKGFFVYEAVEGTYQGEDYPVGYNGETKMGDYFRHLVPTIYGSIEDFPEELRHGIAVSDTLDFTKDRVLDNDKINEYFPRYYGQQM